MPIKIVNCPDKDFTPFVHRAAKFYVEQLLSKQMFDNTDIIIKFDSKIKDYGQATVEGLNSNNKPRKFLILLNPNIGARDILMTLAHEMVHVKQFVYGHTNATLSKWHDLKVDPDKLEYWKQPWEIEAFGLERGLLTKFAIQECLWIFFDDFINPNRKPKKKKIKWKKDLTR